MVLPTSTESEISVCLRGGGKGEWACGNLNPESKLRITVLKLEQKVSEV